MNLHQLEVMCVIFLIGRVVASIGELYYYNKDRQVQMMNAENDNLHEYEVWMEGYNCTGQSKQHEFIGAVRAESFEKACEIAVKQWCKSVADFDKYYDAKTQTFWGCKCYDNENDAAKGFG